MYTGRSEWAAAIREQQAAIAAAPGEAALWVEMAELDRRRGDGAAAREDLQRALAIDPASKTALEELKRPR